MVPLQQFATFSEEQEYPLVWRRDRVPTLTVRSDVAHGVLPDEVTNTLKPKVDAFNEKLPDGYKVEIGGMYESSADASEAVFNVVPLMIILMLTAMMIMLVSFRRLAMVVAIMPLGLIGVVMALLLFNQPLGFVAILGILALLGMIAKNAVILIVTIEEERAAGKNVMDAVTTSATGRLRPMMLTAISTVLGLVPIAPTIFWGPMAIAIMGGLLVATLLTLIFLPVVYVMVFGGSRECRPRQQARGRSRRDERRTGIDAGTSSGWTCTSHSQRQLFNSMDPAPFRERDLDPEVSLYIREWAEELSLTAPLGHQGDADRRTGDQRRRSRRCAMPCTTISPAAPPSIAAI